jgi:WD40 repeat protein
MKTGLTGFSGLTGFQQEGHIRHFSSALSALIRFIRVISGKVLSSNPASGPVSSVFSVVLMCLCVFLVKTSFAIPPVPQTSHVPLPDAIPIYLPHPVAAITSLAYSPDGTRLALGTYGQVIVYDANTWEPLSVTRQVEDTVRSLAFSPDGQTLAIGCGLPGLDGLPLTWDMNTASKPVAYPKQKDTIEAVAFRKDGKGLLCGANDNKVHYFSALPALTGPVLDEHNGRVQAVAFSPRTDFVFITGGLDRIVKVWDQKTAHTVVNFDQSEGGITGLVFIHDTQFVGSSLDGRLYWWGVSYDEKKNRYDGGYHFRTVGAHEGGVLSLAISGDGKRLITCGADRAVTIWNTDGGKIREFKDLAKPMYAVALSPNGKTAVAAGGEGILYVWDVDGNKLINNILPPELPKPSSIGSAPGALSNKNNTAKNTEMRSERHK